MKMYRKQNDGIVINPDNQEYIANIYVMRCFTVTMIVYVATFLLNIVGIFTIEQSLMWKAFIPSVLFYVLVQIVSRMVSLIISRNPE